MGYYMRYISTDEQEISLNDLEAALKLLDSSYTISDGIIQYGEDLYGEIEINPRGSELCDEELDELQDFLENTKSEQKERVVETLRKATAIIALRVLFQGRNPEQTLEKLDPIWQWLFTNSSGLMQADDEGYYDKAGLILSVE